MENKKLRGIYYTPKIVVDYILEEVFKNHDIVKNPEPKVLDLSCGCGNFLIETFDYIYELIENNLEKIKINHGENYIKNISTHIITKCIYGIDIDNNAIDILKKTLINKKAHRDNKSQDISISFDNISCEDSLKKNYPVKFDYIIGNPPYVGHKSLDKEYKKFLLKEYKDVYRDKSDLYYCFYKKSIDLLNTDGKIGLITPRYFLESPSGKYLREYMSRNCNIKKIIDLSCVNVFKSLGISTLISILEKKTNHNKSHIYKLKNDTSLENVNNLYQILQNEKCEKISINQNQLGEDWIILNEEDKKLYSKIENKSNYTLEHIAESFQGIISGCDKAFILSRYDERINYIDEHLLKPWIKNKHINQFMIEESDEKLIYSNDISDIENYPYIKEKCFNPYKNKLENRRECIRKSRKWYELQWGREKSLFERKKIMYPYKSSSNKFAIDENNNFSSADVYSFYIKEEYENLFSYEYIVAILNSNIYDRYFKMTGKCMGNKIYDYYPNKVMKLKIFKDYNYDEINMLSKKIISAKKEIVIIKNISKIEDENNIIYEKINCLENEVNLMKNKINELINKSLNI